MFILVNKATLPLYNCKLVVFHLTSLVENRKQIMSFGLTLQVLMNHRLVETHIFSFVVGRAFVTDIEKLKISSKTRCLDVAKVLNFFSEITKVGLLEVSV